MTTTPTTTRAAEMVAEAHARADALHGTDRYGRRPPQPLHEVIIDLFPLDRAKVLIQSLIEDEDMRALHPSSMAMFTEAATAALAAAERTVA